jgi:hypothetical protein
MTGIPSDKTPYISSKTPYISSISQESDKLTKKLAKSDSPWNGYLVVQKDGTLSRLTVLDIIKKGGREKLQNSKRLDEAIVKYIHENTEKAGSIKEIDQLSKLALHLKDETQKMEVRNLILEAHENLVLRDTRHELRARPNHETHAKQQHIPIQNAIKPLPQPQKPIDQLDVLLRDPQINQKQVSEFITKTFISSLTHDVDIKKMQGLIENNSMVKNAVISNVSRDIHLIASQKKYPVTNPYQLRLEADNHLRLEPYERISHLLVISELEKQIAQNQSSQILEEIHSNVCKAFFQSSPLEEVGNYIHNISLETPGSQKTNTILVPLYQKALDLEARSAEITSYMEAISQRTHADTSIDDLLSSEQNMNFIHNDIFNHVTELADLYSIDKGNIKELPIEREFAALKEKIGIELEKRGQEIDKQTNSFLVQISQITQALQGNPSIDELLNFETAVTLLKNQTPICSNEFEKIFKGTIDAHPDLNKAINLREGSQNLENLLNEKITAKHEEFSSQFNNVQNEVIKLRTELNEPLGTLATEIGALSNEKAILALKNQVDSFIPEYLKLNPGDKTNADRLVANVASLYASLPH